MFIPLSKPDISHLEKKAVLKVLNTPRLSLGPKLDEFEKKFAKYNGSRYAIAVNSGTSGLHLCIKALNIQEEDAVVTTPFSFIASANCILFNRAKPIFVDIDEKTLNIDVNKLSEMVIKLKTKGFRLKTILPVHIFGRPCEMDEMIELAQKHELKIIEDACEAAGAEYLTKNVKRKTQTVKRRDQKLKDKNSCRSRADNKELQKIEDKKHGEMEILIKNKIWKKVGTFGDCGVFGFYPNKQITTGEGGMIVTDDENIYKLCRSMRNQGRADHGRWLQHERLGYNYRISEINCALGVAQLGRIDEILAQREKVAKLYNERLKEIEELIIPQFEENKKISWFVYVVRLTNKYSKKDRDLVLNKLEEKGIGCSNYFSPIHLQPFYRKIFGYKKGNFPVTERVSEKTIALPFFNNLKDIQIDYVCENLKKIIQSLRVVNILN